MLFKPFGKQLLFRITHTQMPCTCMYICNTPPVYCLYGYSHVWLNHNTSVHCCVSWVSWFSCCQMLISSCAFSLPAMSHMLPIKSRRRSFRLHWFPLFTLSTILCNMHSWADGCSVGWPHKSCYVCTWGSQWELEFPLDLLQVLSSHTQTRFKVEHRTPQEATFTCLLPPLQYRIFFLSFRWLDQEECGEITRWYTI